VAEKTSLDLGLTVGLVAADGGGDYEYGTASASLGYGFTDDVSAYVGANYSLSSIDSLNFRRFEDTNGAQVKALPKGRAFLMSKVMNDQY